MDKGASILVTGHRGMVGSALLRLLSQQSYQNIHTTTGSQTDLRCPQQTEQLLSDIKPDYLFLCAAKVGGIYANNQYPAEFIYDNLMIEANVIQAAYKFKLKGLLFFGSSCIYPKLAEQPMREDALLTGQLEPTNEPYAIAKIAGIKLCESYNRQYGTNFRSIMPTNIYGPKDNFHLQNSHVIAAMLHKFHLAKQQKQDKMLLWGTGSPRREFIHVDDLAAAAIFVMQLPQESWMRMTHPMLSHINVGTGKDISIRELATIIKDIVGYSGKVEWDDSMPDGTPQKLLDVKRLTDLGWQAQIPLANGLKGTYEWFCQHYASLNH